MFFGGAEFFRWVAFLSLFHGSLEVVGAGGGGRSAFAALYTREKKKKKSVEGRGRQKGKEETKETRSGVSPEHRGGKKEKNEVPSVPFRPGKKKEAGGTREAKGKGNYRGLGAG